MDTKKNVLWVSMLAPYDTVGHAGGKIHNYYLKYLHGQNRYNIRLVSTYKKEEASRLDLDAYGIRYDMFRRKREGLVGLVCKAVSWSSKSYIFNQYAGLTPFDISYGLKKELRKVAGEGYQPDLVILQWTEVIFLAPYVKSLFPYAKYLAIEEDISFQSMERKWRNSQNIFIRGFFKIKREKVKKKEINLLNGMDQIIVNNVKDRKLLLEADIVKDIFVWVPFYQNYKDTVSRKRTKDIVFYGAMARPENWKSAVWFIENVFPKIAYEGVRFVVVGGSPNPVLKRYASDKIIIKGWVERVEDILSESLCLVAPLVLGAGIKIKILEAMSCGTVVLTNDIGIEGIPAAAGREYLHCNTAKEYINAIVSLIDGTCSLEEISHNARAFMKEHFDVEASSQQFSETVAKMLD